MALILSVCDETTEIDSTESTTPNPCLPAEPPASRSAPDNPLCDYSKRPLKICTLVKKQLQDFIKSSLTSNTAHTNDLILKSKFLQALIPW